MDDNMNKRPSLQFYPADWLKDPDLQMCSMNTIGIWINLMCRMWEAKEEGILKGTAGELALLVGAKPMEFKKFLKDAQSHNFCNVLHNVTKSYTIVTIKCRRMNKLFLLREGAKKRMKKYRKTPRDDDVTAHSSTSSSSSTSNNKYMSIFDEARKLFKGTKRGNQTEFDNFKKKHKNWKEVLPFLKPAIEQQIIWRQQDQRYWKHFQTWINQSCWEEEESEDKASSISTVSKKTKLFPIQGKTCSEDGCKLPAVYKSTGGAYDFWYCSKHMPDSVKELYE